MKLLILVTGHFLRTKRCPVCPMLRLRFIRACCGLRASGFSEVPVGPGLRGIARLALLSHGFMSLKARRGLPRHAFCGVAGASFAWRVTRAFPGVVSTIRASGLLGGSVRRAYSVHAAACGVRAGRKKGEPAVLRTRLCGTVEMTRRGCSKHARGVMPESEQPVRP